MVGDSITIHGLEGDAVEVTVVRVIDPAKAANSFLAASKNKHYVEIRIAPQDAVYSDSPGNGAALIDEEGRQYTETYAEVKGAQGFGGSAKVSPGDQRLGVIIFEVPDGTKLQFTLNSGFADETAEWSL